MLASDRIEDLWTAMRSVAAEHVAGITELAEAYVGDRSGLEPVTRHELELRLSAGDVVVLDVRPLAEYQAGHIPFARSVPASELRRLRNLSKETEIVAYCRGPYCVYADDAVRQLRRRGYRARDSKTASRWKRAGLPIATG
jgi:rhodanese-related sulfurtransferase